jgi:hypothetical protein
LNDRAEITELAATEILVEINRALLLFGGGRNEFHRLLLAENLSLNLFRDMVLLELGVAIIKLLHCLT